MVLETSRLFLREMKQSDYLYLCKILQDKDVMYAYDGVFSDEETQNWLDKQINNYAQYGFGLWAVILKENDKMIGQCGLTMQEYNDKQVLEVGYLFQKAFWHKGYAIEAAQACRDYAFEQLNADEVFSIVRDTNTASQNVAKRNGMMVKGVFVKHYRGIDMPHYAYSVKRTG
jgi:RimJ/RimL family protein N-acetyltransferase